MFRLLVTGSRSWTDDAAIFKNLTQFCRARDLKPSEIILVHGACPKGADKIANDWAENFNVNTETHPAQWNSIKTIGPTDEVGRTQPYDKAAGFKRNKLMVDLGADQCIAFIKDNSGGASHTVKLAREAKIPTIVWRQYTVHDNGEPIIDELPFGDEDVEA